MDRIEHLKVVIIGKEGLHPTDDQGKAVEAVAKILRPHIPGVVMGTARDEDEIEFYVSVDVGTLEKML